MASLKQIEANRRNAQKSTGPRTAQGKAISRCNAIKSGIHAELPTLPGEDSQARTALVESFHNAYRPATSEERELVDSLAQAEWQLQRFRHLELCVYGDHPNPADPFIENLALFAQLYTRQTRANRCYHRVLLELLRLQSLRCRAARAAKIGFVSNIRAARQPSLLKSAIAPP